MKSSIYIYKKQFFFVHEDNQVKNKRNNQLWNERKTNKQIANEHEYSSNIFVLFISFCLFFD